MTLIGCGFSFESMKCTNQFTENYLENPHIYDLFSVLSTHLTKEVVALRKDNCKRKNFYKKKKKKKTQYQI